MLLNGTSAVPRSWKPQAVTQSESARTIFFISYDQVDEPSRHHDHLLHVVPGDEALHVGIGERKALDRRPVGRLRHPDGAAQLAVDLDDELDLVLLERRRVGLGPWR